MTLLLAVGAACSPPGAHTASAQGTAAELTPVVVRSHRISTRLHSDLTEASAAVMSRTQGVFWSVNDSGNEPILFAIDTNGRHTGAWRVRGARNLDWEAAALGPCGAAGAGSCVYVGDVGDNGAVRSAVMVYRVPEPSGAQPGDTAPAEGIVFHYSEGRHDVEAMYVAADGTMFFITKRPLRDSAGRLRQALVFSLPATEWNAGSSRATATLIDSLPIVPGSAGGRMITDAALAPDGRHLAVRTYSEVYVFATDPASGRIRAGVSPVVCDVSRLGEPQGEAVTWLDATGRLLLMSEGRRAPLHAIDCPTPPRRGT